MTCTLDISREQEEALRLRASRLGLDLSGYLARLIDADTGDDGGSEENRQAMQLIRAWQADDEAMSPEDAVKAEADWQELRAGLNANRAAIGARPMFP